MTSAFQPVAMSDRTDLADAWPDELEALYRNEGREIWGILYARCLDADRALEALQEAFLRLLQERGRVHDPRAWVIRVAQNWLTDLHRKNTRLATADVELEDIHSNAATVEELMEREELREMVRDALAELRADDRELLVLRHALGWPSVRIAEKLLTTVAAVDMRLSRARARLADVLSRRGVQYETT